ncbi:MAG: DUF6687 family protein [Acidimicrobiales bacterium]
MSTPPLEFLGYEASRTVANIVVDGSANESTVLTLSHWPGTPQVPHLADDLSAQMCFRYLDDPPDHPVASVATNNHYDQDGLMGLTVLVDPDGACAHRQAIVDIAAAGDFATFRDRSAARASMVISTWADPDRSPFADRLRGLPYPDQSDLLYRTTLPLVIDLITDVDRFAPLWAEEDAALTASEDAIERGDITIAEDPTIDLAVVTIDPELELTGGHRFGGRTFDEVHPMAIHNATDRVRLLVLHGQRVVFVDRYETWVQYRSRPLPPRVDLSPLARQLDGLETGSSRWSAEPPGALTPRLSPDGPSSLDHALVIEAVARHLAEAPAAWFPETADA